MNESGVERKSFILVFSILIIFFLLNKVIHFPRPKNEKRYHRPNQNVVGESWSKSNVELNKSFKTAHSDFHNSDQVSTLLGPSPKLDWVVEKDKFIVEGPTVDKKGNLYVSPLWSPEKVILFSLEPNKGKRRWAIPGVGHGGGAPLILEDPKTKKEVIYISVYHKAYAVTTDGKILWEKRTGLPTPSKGALHRDHHCYGLNYIEKHDILVGLMGDGHLIFLDRKTGKNILPSPFLIPGSPSTPSLFKKQGPPEWIKKRADKVLLPLARGRTTERPFTDLVDVLLGGGTKVANYFSVNKYTGKIWVVATAPDGVDHKIDDLSEYGALYGLDLVKKNNLLSPKVSCQYFFKGGSGSTPALNGTGKRVYVGTGKNTMVALDSESCKKVWEYESDESIVASPAVDQSTNEIYIPTMFSIIKLQDEGSSFKKVWTSSFNTYKLAIFQKSFQMLTPLITPSGIVTFFGAGYKRRDIPIPLALSLGVLDKKNGRVRFFSPAREESVGILSMGKNGALYVTHSPVRRAVSRAIFSDLVDPLIGGVAKYSSDPTKTFLREIIETLLSYEKNTKVGVIGNSWKKTLSDVLSQANFILSALIKSSLSPNEKLKKIENFFIEAEVFLEKGETRSFFSHIRKSKKQLN